MSWFEPQSLYFPHHPTYCLCQCFHVIFSKSIQICIFFIPGIVGEQLDIDDPLVLTEHMNSNDDAAVLSEWMDRCRTNVGEDAVNDIQVG